ARRGGPVAWLDRAAPGGCSFAALARARASRRARRGGGACLLPRRRRARDDAGRRTSTEIARHQSLLDALTPDELRAALAHEVAHSTALDNFKRLAMRAVPDALSVCPASRRLEYEWMQAAEYAADARAARDARTRLTLASALVKVAQRAPSPL